MKENKFVLITGASSGIGKELAKVVAEHGYSPILVARRGDIISRLEHELKYDYNVNTYSFVADISKKEEREKLVKEIYNAVPRVDVLVNNAGFGVFEEAKDTKADTIEEMFQVNVIGLFDLTRLLLNHMLAEKTGHIINIASVAGIMPTPKASVYAATKHAVLGFTDALRMEVKDKGIYVSSFNPGPVSSPFHKRADASGEYEKSVGKFMVTPADTAKKILKLIEKPKRTVYYPWYMGAGGKMYQLAPGLVEKIAGPFLFKK